MGKCILVGAGDFFEKTITYEKDDLIIAADGGLKALLLLELAPDIIIGDMDSLNDDALLKNMISENIDIIVLPKEKDDTDMLAAIRIGLDKGYREFVMYGALGGRFDHSFANIQCLDFLKESNANGVIIDRGTSIELLKNEKKFFDKAENGYFSVFAFGGDAAGVTEMGLKYEIKEALLKPSFPIGVSNEFVGKESSVEVTAGKLLVMKVRETEC